MAYPRRADLLTSIVLIAPRELVDALKERLRADDAEVVTFAHTEPLQALEAITKRRPNVIGLERLFAATPRGAALISRVKSDPKLAESEIRVLSHDSDYVRVVPRAPKAPGALDQRGTRRAPRFKMAAGVTALVEGAPATLVDLSTVGAQIVASSVLKPNQLVQVGLKDDQGIVEVNAELVWTSFEVGSGGDARYRAGVNFTQSDPASVNAFCSRHKAA